MKLGLITIAGVLVVGCGAQVWATSCRAITGAERGTPTGERIRAANKGTLRAAGLTNVLTSFGDPGKCWNLVALNSGPKGFKPYKLTGTDLCVSFYDYGVGSFDPLKHDYCKNNAYILQLHDESPAGFRLYQTIQNRKLSEVQLVAEFDKQGRKVPASITLTP